MKRFKDTPAFQNLQTILSDEIAGNFVERLKEVGVPDEKLVELADNICYDIASAINIIGDFEIPNPDNKPVKEEKEVERPPASRQDQDEDELNQEAIFKILNSTKPHSG